jgi:hypothetical protein
MAENVRKLRTEGSIDGGGEGGLELSDQGNVRKSDAFRCEVRAGSKVFFDDGKCGNQSVLENGVYLEGYLSRKYTERGW